MSKKVYIVSSSTITSGGTQSLHQLADLLTKEGLDTYIYYKNPHILKPLEKFQKYDFKVASEIEDTAGNVVIVPESFTGFLEKYSSVKKVIWWLSLDFHFLSTPDKRAKKFLKKRKLPVFMSRIVELSMLIRGYSTLDDYKLVDLEKDKNIYHLYNCEYVYQFLIENNNVPSDQTQYLCGPISDIYFKDVTTNKNRNKTRILYNPAKGNEYILQIKEKCQNKNWDFHEIKGYSEDEIIKLMDDSRLYIDFGFFPGPERIPREAVLRNVNIITSKFGAAKNEIDVPIPEEFKFDLNGVHSLEDVINKIEDCLLNYENKISQFDQYRQKIEKQKSHFIDYVKELCMYIEE